MNQTAYRLRAANGDWPDKLTEPVLDETVIADTDEEAQRAGFQRLWYEHVTLHYDHAWVEDAEGSIIWASATDDQFYDRYGEPLPGPPGPEKLTPEEIEDLRRDARAAKEYCLEYFRKNPL